MKDEYKFGIPQLDATCTCQCTKGTEATDCPKIDRCSDDDINCVEWNDLSDNTKVSRLLDYSLPDQLGPHITEYSNSTPY